MAKPAYKEILCNYDMVPEDRRHELIQRWNYGKVDIMINKILELPSHLQMPVLEAIKEDYSCKK